MRFLFVAVSVLVFHAGASFAGTDTVQIPACKLNDATHACPPDFKLEKVICVKAPCDPLCKKNLPKKLKQPAPPPNVRLAKPMCPPGYEAKDFVKDCDLVDKDATVAEVLPCSNSFSLTCPIGYQMVSQPMKCSPGSFCPAVMQTRCVRGDKGADGNAPADPADTVQ